MDAGGVWYEWRFAECLVKRQPFTVPLDRVGDDGKVSRVRRCLDEVPPLDGRCGEGLK